jgi:hypothetical protein
MPRRLSICAVSAAIVVALFLLVSYSNPFGIPAKRLAHPNPNQFEDDPPPIQLNEHLPEALEPLPTEEPSISTPKGKEILLIVGTDGHSHADIEGMEIMVRENRGQYATFHGTIVNRLVLTWAFRLRFHVGEFLGISNRRCTPSMDQSPSPCRRVQKIPRSEMGLVVGFRRNYNDTYYRSRLAPLTSLRHVLTTEKRRSISYTRRR